MITPIPFIANVADLQRGYRALVERIKKTGEPLVIVNNGKPDVVVMDVDEYNLRVKRLNSLEEEYLLKHANLAQKEYKSGKTVRLEKNQKLIDLLD